MAIARHKITQNYRKKRKTQMKKVIPGVEVHMFVGRLMQSDPITRGFTMSARKAVKRKKDLGLPVPRYDEKNDIAFLEYPDGHKEYIQVT